MKVLFFTFMMFSGLQLWAQDTKLESIYNQISPVPNKFLCENADSYLEETALFEALSAQLEEMRLNLDEKLKTNDDKTYITNSAEFPSDEELRRVENLSDEEQQAFWQKFEAKQTSSNNAIAFNQQKYQAEKESLINQARLYHDELLLMIEECSEVHYLAMKVKSDKRQKIYDTYMANNTLTKYGEQQLAEIHVEFCYTVSKVLLNKIRFEYKNLKQNILLNKRLIIIEFLEFSNLKEEDVYKQKAVLLELTELEILAQYIDSYKKLLYILPGSIDN